MVNVKKILSNERIIIIVLLLLLGLGINFHLNQQSKAEKKYENQVKLTEALQDSIRFSENVRGELVAEKRTIQTELNNLKKENFNLTENQKNLIKRIEESENKGRIINAALITASVKIDSLENLIAEAATIDTDTNTITFIENDSTSDFQYSLLVKDVLPVESKIPTLTFRNIEFPNQQYIEFFWDENKRKDYPVSFKVSNSNKYFKTYDIDSYAIPELDKDTVKPTTGQKIKNFFKKNGKYFIIGVAGFAAGAAISGN
jgi:hypothetical protein